MQIESYSPFESLEITCDGTVPMILRFNGYAGPISWAPNYWRTGDLEYSLVEIAVDPTTGTICKIVVTSIQEISTESQLTKQVIRQMGCAVPNAMLTTWKGDQTRVDVEGDVGGYLDGRTYTILFGGEQLANNVVNCGRVDFLMNSTDELCGFQVVELTDRELGNLRYSIEPIGGILE